MTQQKNISKLLTIAGSDPSGGAGIQADLKTFSALGCYGMSVITALTAQNTMGVQGVHFVPPEFVVQQLRSIFADIRPDAIKIGMAGTAATIAAIAEFLSANAADIPIILDPVMVAQSGGKLLADDAAIVLRDVLMPLATLATPNWPEASVLLDRVIADTLSAQDDAARELLTLGAKSVFLKGGHSESISARDVLVTSQGLSVFQSPRLDTKNTHGTGCTLAAALACFMAQGFSLPDSAQKAKAYITKAIEAGRDLHIGHGAGPVQHFFEWWRGGPS
jgi:hydroxymethylpyrimidine/phosphomethylpyrimidine kinase